MGAPSTPKRTPAQKALETEQARQLSELTEEENRRAKALQRGRLGMRQLLGPMGVLGSDAKLGGMPEKPPGAPDSGYRPAPPPGKGPTRGRGARRSLVGFGGGTGAGGMGGNIRRVAQ